MAFWAAYVLLTQSVAVGASLSLWYGPYASGTLLVLLASSVWAFQWAQRGTAVSQAEA